MKLGDKAADLLNLELARPGITGQRQQARQVAPVIADGMRRLPALFGQFDQIVVNRRRRGHLAGLATRTSAAEIISPMRSR